jgi:cold shock CspA family protein
MSEELLEVELVGGFRTTFTRYELRKLAARLLALADTPKVENGQKEQPPQSTEPKMVQGHFDRWDPDRGFGYVVPDGDRTSFGIFVHKSKIEGTADDARLVRGARCRFSWVVQTEGNFAGRRQVTRLVVLP